MNSPRIETDGNRPDELLAVVNEHDEEIGAERRDVIHARGLLHRAVHVLVCAPDGRLLIQQRSSLKDTFPLHWECVGGHLSPGEAYRNAAEREVLEELGLAVEELQFLGKVAACEQTGMEFIEVYRATVSGTPRPAPSEVVAVEWMTMETLARELIHGGRLYSPTFRHTLKETGLLASPTVLPRPASE